MRLYLFVIDGKPMARSELHQAQAALEDHFRDHRDVSDVWWDDNRPHEARTYLYGSSHCDFGRDPLDPYLDVNFETTDQIIFPVDLGPEQMVPAPSVPSGVTMSLSVVTPDKKIEMTRGTSLEVWDSSAINQSTLVILFAAEAAHHVSGALSPKEGS